MAQAQPVLPAIKCEYPFEKVVATLDRNKTPYVVLEPKPLLGVTVKGGGNILIAALNGELVIGFVIDGCVVGPIPVAPLVPAASVM